MIFRLLAKCTHDKPLNSVNCKNSSVCFVMKYCPASTVVRNPASVQNLITRFCCDSLSTRSWYFCNMSRIIGRRCKCFHQRTCRHKKWVRLSCHNKSPRSYTFAFERSSGQWTRGSENWVSALSEFEHHQFSDSVPFSLWFAFMSRIPLRFWSRSEEWPTSCWKSFCKCRHKCGISTTFLFIVFNSPYDVIEHRHEDDPVNSSGSSLICDRNSGTLLHSCNVVNPGKIFHSNSTGSPSIVSNVLYCDESLNHSNCRSHTVFDIGFWFILQDITQNLRIHKPLHARDWRLLHHWPEIIVSMENLPSWFETLQKSNLIVPISTFRYLEHLLECEIFHVFLMECNCLSNSIPWIQMLPMSKT